MNDITHFPEHQDIVSSAEDQGAGIYQDSAFARTDGQKDDDAVLDASGNATSKTAGSGRVFANAAVNSAGKKIGSWKGQLDRTTESCSTYIKDEPAKSIVFAAVFGSLLTALVMNLARRDRPSYY